MPSEEYPDVRSEAFSFGNHEVNFSGDIDALREKLYHFYIAVEQSPVATSITDVEARIVFVNQQFLDVTGYTREEVLGKTPAMIKSGMTPDEVYQDMWQTLRNGRVWRGELLNRKKSGELYWEKEVITPVRNDQGEIVNYVAVKEDITERKRQEAQLRLLATAFETGQATLITDAELRIEQVNQAFTQITGYRSEEVIGRTPRMFKSGRQNEAFYQVMWSELLASDHWQGEMWNRKKDGAVYPVWQSITAVRDEFGKIRHYIAVFHDIAERKRLEKRLEAQATQDHLTGVANRRAFDDAIHQSVEQAQAGGQLFSLLMVDIDYFKSVNDVYGHDVGDIILKQLTEMMQQLLRKTDVLSRWGGEEFTILLPGAPLEGAQRFAERVRQRVETSLFHGLNVTISIGLTQYGPGDDSMSMIMRADKALYQAKRDGRNRVVARSPVNEEKVAPVAVAG